MLSVHSCPLGQLGGRDTGGMNVYVRELARALGEQGHRVDIYTRAHDVRDKQVYFPGRNVRLIHIRAGGLEDMGKTAQYRHLPEFTSGLEGFRTRQGLEYDLVHSHYWLSGQVGQWLSGMWRVPNIVMFHTLGVVKTRLGIGHNETELRLETERGLVRDCHRIITATEREKGDLVSHYQASPQKIRIIPCGVNLELFKPIDRETSRQTLGLNGDNLILFVGRIEPLKGIDRLLRAVGYLKGQPGLRLIVIGGDDFSQSEVARLEALSRDLGIEGSVSFPGSVPQERLSLFYSAADVLVVPSYYETFSLVVLESLACGTPVVATDVGIAAGVIRPGKTGYLVADNSPPKLARAIERSLSLDRNGADSARETILDFDWSNIARALTEEYYSVLAAIPSPCPRATLPSAKSGGR